MRNVNFLRALCARLWRKGAHLLLSSAATALAWPLDVQNTGHSGEKQVHNEEKHSGEQHIGEKHK